jgi:hypothetical protein
VSDWKGFAVWFWGRPVLRSLVIETQIRELALPKSRYVVEVTPPWSLYRCTDASWNRPGNGQIGSDGRRPTLTDVSQKSASGNSSRNSRRRLTDSQIRAVRIRLKIANCSVHVRQVFDIAVGLVICQHRAISSVRLVFGKLFVLQVQTGQGWFRRILISLLFLRDKLIFGRFHMRRICQLLQSTGASLPNVSNGAPEEKGAVVFRVMFQDGHDEHKPIEICKLQQGVDFEMSA